MNFHVHGRSKHAMQCICLHPRNHSCTAPACDITSAGGRKLTKGASWLRKDAAVPRRPRNPKAPVSHPSASYCTQHYPSVAHTCDCRPVSRVGQGYCLNHCTADRHSAREALLLQSIPKHCAFTTRVKICDGIDELFREWIMDAQ